MPKYKSELAGAIHDSVKGLFELGFIGKAEMRHFDKSCLTPVKRFSPEQIQRLRAKAKVSQAVFAAHLWTTAGAVSQWERGIKTPSTPVMKLLSLVEKRGLDAIA